MAWSEFWGLFTKYLQHSLLCVVAMIQVSISLLLGGGLWLVLQYLIDKHAQAKKKNREKNGTTNISKRREEGEGENLDR